MDITINQIIETISKFVQYIDNCVEDCREKEFAIQKLEESVFWLVYFNEDKEEENDG